MLNNIFLALYKMAKLFAYCLDLAELIILFINLTEINSPNYRIS